jgi:hypothetical protein
MRRATLNDCTGNEEIDGLIVEQVMDQMDDDDHVTARLRLNNSLLRIDFVTFNGQKVAQWDNAIAVPRSRDIIEDADGKQWQCSSQEQHPVFWALPNWCWVKVE